MSSTVRVAVGQFAPVMGQLKKNCKLVAEMAAEAADMGARFIVFPEMCLTGADTPDKDIRKTAIFFDNPALEVIRKTARQKKIGILPGACEKTTEGTYYMTHLVFLPDGTLTWQRKGGAYAYEDGWRWDTTRTVFRIHGLRVGLIICADSSNPKLYRALLKQGVDVICHPSMGYGNWGSIRKTPDAARLADHDRLMFSALRSAQTMARDMKVAYIVSNPIGCSGNVYWPGNSGIVDRDGVVRAWLPSEFFTERMRPGFVVGSITR